MAPTTIPKGTHALVLCVGSCADRRTAPFVTKRAYLRVARRVAGIGRTSTVGQVTVAQRFRYGRQLLGPTSEKGRTVTTNRIRSREAEVVRKPIGESITEYEGLCTMPCVGPFVEEASRGKDNDGEVDPD